MKQLLAFLLSVLASGAAFAQAVPQYATACPAVSTAATATTSTPGTGLFVYVLGVTVDLNVGTALVSAISNAQFTSTNLPGSPIWSYSLPVTANSYYSVARETYAFPGVKASAAATAVTVVSPALVTGLQYCTKIVYYIAP